MNGNKLYPNKLTIPMAVNSKSKGGRFERTMSKWFTNWTGYEFNRVPASGGLRWKNAENITSDIACTDSKHSKKFRFSVECKSYKELNFEHVLLEKKSCKILKFWEQARDDAKRANKFPLLVMKYNGMSKGEAFVMVGYNVYVKCIQPFREKMNKAQMAFHLDPKNRVGDESALYCFLLSDLKEIPYDEFNKLVQKLYKETYPKKK